ncbi:MAG: hypothetical protein U1E73_05395 [Planctomycetota bacterium]
MTTPIRLSASIATNLLLAGAACGQWTCVRLHPANATAPQALATAGALQGGNSVLASTFHACTWNGAASTFVDLHPAGATSSQVLAMTPFVQVGLANQHAALWNGSAASYVDLNPVGSTTSAIRGTDGLFHVGNIRVGIQDHACVWSGTSMPPYDLQTGLSPSSAGSYAFSISGGQIVGYYNTSNVSRAIVWQDGT